jgi:hypothetical protein
MHCDGNVDAVAAPAADGNCRFPPFLLQSQFHHSVGPDASISDRSANVDAVWLTETRFERGTFHVASELEVTVRGGDTLVTKIRHPGTCSSADEDDPSSAYNVSCHQREFLYQRLCLSAMDSEKYVVEHNDGL